MEVAAEREAMRAARRIAIASKNDTPELIEEKRLAVQREQMRAARQKTRNDTPEIIEEKRLAVQREAMRAARRAMLGNNSEPGAQDEPLEQSNGSQSSGAHAEGCVVWNCSRCFNVGNEGGVQCSKCGAVQDWWIVQQEDQAGQGEHSAESIHAGVLRRNSLESLDSSRKKPLDHHSREKRNTAPVGGVSWSIDHRGSSMPVGQLCDNDSDEIDEWIGTAQLEPPLQAHAPDEVPTAAMQGGGRTQLRRKMSLPELRDVNSLEMRRAAVATADVGGAGRGDWLNRFEVIGSTVVERAHNHKYATVPEPPRPNATTRRSKGFREFRDCNNSGAPDEATVLPELVSARSKAFLPRLAPKGGELGGMGSKFSHVENW